MKRLIVVIVTTILLLSAKWSAAQLIPFVLEKGDSLVSNTPDTIPAFALYKNADFDSRRSIHPTLFLDFDEIGSNTTHYTPRIEIALSPKSLAIADDGWALVRSIEYNDLLGVNTASQNDLVLPLSFLDNYAAEYCRIILSYVYGGSGDSTAYSAYYLTENVGNSYAPQFNGLKHISHKEMFNNTAKQTISGLDSVTTVPMDLRIETTPGNYQLADRGYLMVSGLTKCDGDSLRSYLYPVSDFGLFGTQRLDTLSMPLAIATAGIASISVSTVSGIPPYGFLRFLGLTADAPDTSSFYADLYLECDP